MLTRIKISFADIKKGLLDLDDERLSVELLEKIRDHLPNSEEVLYSSIRYPTTPLNSLQIGRLKEFDDLSTFSKADQYFGEVGTTCFSCKNYI